MVNSVISFKLRQRNTIATAPVDALEREGRSLLQRMRLGPTHGDATTEGSGGSHGSWLSGGADFQSVAPKVSSLLERLQAARSHLLQSWSDRKLVLDLQHFLGDAAEGLCYLMNQLSVVVEVIMRPCPQVGLMSSGGKPAAKTHQGKNQQAEYMYN